MGKYIGIDLGTTYSVAAYIDDDGIPQVIANSDGDRKTPSTVLFDDDVTLVGSEAKRESDTNPNNYVAFAKRKMGSTKIEWNIEGKSYRPEEISAIVLKKIKNDCEQTLGEEVSGAVITVPAYFTDAQRSATKQAAQIAGINALGIINEPTAAALAYGIKKNDTAKKRILIYDLGGGTFDISIMEIGNGEINTIATDGIPTLGGYDFDKKIVEWFTKKLSDKGIAIAVDSEIYRKLMINAETIKISLSSGKKVTRVSCSIQGKKYTEELSLEEFEEMLQPIVYKTISIMDGAMEEAGLDYEELDKILLVGGSTKMPLIRNVILDGTGVEPSKDIHPDEAVAIGAAYYVVDLAKNKEPTEENNLPALETSLNFTDCTSHGIGIVAGTGESDREFNSVIMEKNTPLPSECARDYSMAYDQQDNILLRITQGEDEDLAFTTIIGEAEIRFSPRPKGAPIRVVISCDSEALIHVHVIDLMDNSYLGEAHIERLANLTDQEVEDSSNKIGKLNIG